jgi:hypothetical protein
MTRGEIEPKFIYGFGEETCGQVIDYNFLDYYPYEGIYTDQLVRNSPRQAFYGRQCFESDGYKLSEGEKKIVDDFCKYINLYKKSKDKFAEELVPGYHLVLSGDINWDMTEEYYPDGDMKLLGVDNMSDNDNESDDDESDKEYLLDTCDESDVKDSLDCKLHETEDEKLIHESDTPIYYL